MRSKLRALAVGGSYGVLAKLAGLPFNRDFHAYNIFDFEVGLDAVEEAHDLYLRHIAPAADRADGPYRSGAFSFSVKRPPGWGSDLQWWSADDVPTFHHFEELFHRLGVDERLFPGVVNGESRLRVYSSSLFTRSHCEKTHFHTDFLPTCGTSVYTLIAPLQHPPSGAAQLVYRDASGHERVYSYRKGRAIAFGALLSHGTHVGTSSPTAFLSYTFGTSKLKRWREVKKTLDYCGCRWPPPTL